MSAARRHASGMRPLVVKLHRWELQHLREHTAELYIETEHLRAEVARLQRELEWSDQCAQSWLDDVMRLMEDGEPLGLTITGQVVRVDPAAALALDRAHQQAQAGRFAP